MFIETYTGDYIHVTREDLEQMPRSELEHYLILRGFATYDSESTSLLREMAIEDLENELS